MTTPKESAVLKALGEAWGAFLKLPVQHPDEVREFHASIHRLQDIVACRIARRADPKNWPCFDKDGNQTPIDPS